MSDMRKYINTLNESFVPGINEASYEDGVIEILNRYPGAIDALKSGDFPEDPELMDELYNYFLNSDQMPYGTAKARDGNPEEWIWDQITQIVPMEGNADGWEAEPMRPYDEAVEGNSIYQGADEYADTVEPCCSGGDGDTPDEKFGTDEVYEEEVDEEWTPPLESGEESEDPVADEWWQNQFNETLERMKNLAGIRVVSEEEDSDEDEELDEGNKPDFLDVDGDGDKEEDMKDAIKDKKEVDEDKDEEVNEAAELARIKHLSGISEDSIYPDASHMNTEKKWDEMGNEAAGPHEKFGDDEIYDGEACPMAHNKHTDRPGEDKMPSAPFSHKMAEAAVAGKETFKHKGQTFKVRMNEERARALLEKKPSAGLSSKKKSATVKKAKAGGDIGKKGKNFKKVAAKAAKKYGSKESGKKVAAAAMWKNAKR